MENKGGALVRIGCDTHVGYEPLIARRNARSGLPNGPGKQGAPAPTAARPGDLTGNRAVGGQRQTRTTDSDHRPYRKTHRKNAPTNCRWAIASKFWEPNRPALRPTEP